MIDESLDMKLSWPAKLSHVYFIGIAGIGMSALARYFQFLGARISGYDRDRSDLAIQLENEGMRIHYEEDIEMIPEDLDLVVYTPAIPDAHVELAHLRALEMDGLGASVLKRSEALGWISSDRRCIAVAGTHGKTTTSAMITYLLRKNGVDATGMIGGLVHDFNGNFIAGKSDWVVLEADEYDRSFLQLIPQIAVITSADPDHLDVYGSRAEMEEGYVAFVERIRIGGKLIMYNGINQKLKERITEECAMRQIQLEMYGRIPDDIIWHKKSQSGMLGSHNALNGIAALKTCAGVVGSEEIIGLEGFKGIKRRFEIVFQDKNRTIIDDYAHHPEEIKAAVAAAKNEFSGKRITGVFQPHLYSRTRDFYKEFAQALGGMDECILVPLYPARERPIKGVSSELIYECVNGPAKYHKEKKELLQCLKKLNPEVLLLLGAGDLDRMIPQIIDTFQK